jgi:hypothetical protein
MMSGSGGGRVGGTCPAEGDGIGQPGGVCEQVAHGRLPRSGCAEMGQVGVRRCVEVELALIGESQRGRGGHDLGHGEPQVLGPRGRGCAGDEVGCPGCAGEQQSVPIDHGQGQARDPEPPHHRGDRGSDPCGRLGAGERRSGNRSRPCCWLVARWNWSLACGLLSSRLGSQRVLGGCGFTPAGSLQARRPARRGWRGWRRRPRRARR